jgi:hypothetical protein
MEGIRLSGIYAYAEIRMRGMMGYGAVNPTDNDSKLYGERGKGKGEAEGRYPRKARAVNEKIKVFVSN